MYSCSDLPNEPDDVILKKHSKCNASFRERFSFYPMKVLGKGTGGTVYSAFDKQDNSKQIAVKIIPYANRLEALSRKELGIACELNSLKDLTPVFVHTFGYLICNIIPSKWKTQLPPQYQNEAMYMYIFMHKPDTGFLSSGGLDDGRYMVTGLEKPKYAISLLFLLVHAIYVARKLLEFAHHDLHEGNIMFDISTSSDGLFSLDVENITHQVKFMRGWVPKLIDFGNGTTKNHPYERAQNNGQDIFKMFNLFLKRKDLAKALDLDPVRERNVPLLDSKYNDYKIVAKFLLNDPIFENVSTIERIQKKRLKLEQQMCNACGAAPAAFEFKGRQTVLCNEFCGSRIKSLSGILPFK